MFYNSKSSVKFQQRKKKEQTNPTYLSISFSKVENRSYFCFNILFFILVQLVFYLYL